jgi:hypothetical protein
MCSSRSAEDRYIDRYSPYERWMPWASMRTRLCHGVLFLAPVGCGCRRSTRQRTPRFNIVEARCARYT